jgi:hypothetical protein
MPIVEGAEQMIRREFPFHSVEESDDGRWYIIDGQRLMSVTTALDALGKRGLIIWSANLAAELAFVELPRLAGARHVDPCGRTWSRCRHEDGETCERCPCRECRACTQAWVARRHERESSRRADEGTRVHDVIEWWTLHDEIKAHDDDIAPYVEAFLAFVAEYGIRPDDFLLSEALLVHRDIGAAGTTDGVVRIHAERTPAAAKLVSRLTGVPWRKAMKLKLTVDVIVDWKTREDDEAQYYPEYALQLAGYRHFPVVRLKDSDVEVPMLPTDGGVIVQLRPNGAGVRLVVCDEDTFRRGFLNALGLYEWLIECGPASVSSRTFVLPETLAARARKAAQEQAAAEGAMAA